MKVQLVLAPVSEEKEKVDKWYMPLGLVNLGTFVDDICDVEILDGSHLDEHEIAGRVDGDLVGITYTALSAANAADIARAAKANGSFVVFGGQAATANPLNLFQLPETDAVVVHDGEFALRKLVQNRFRNLHEVPNLFYRDNGDVRFTPVKNLTPKELNTIPNRTVGGLNLEDYIERGFPDTNTLLNLEGINRPTNVVFQRGCTRRCSFCARQDKDHRTRTPENAIDELRYLKDEFGIDYVIDHSDTFAFGNWLEEFSKVYSSSGLNLGMMVFADIRDITPEKLRNMRQCGIDNILYGVESGSEEILRRNYKPYSRERIIEVIDQTINSDIKVSASFVIGLLGERRDTLDETEDLICKLDDRGGFLPYVNVIIPLPGSLLWREFMSKPGMKERYGAIGFNYDFTQIREDYLGSCTEVTLPELIEMRDRINVNSRLVSLDYEYAR